ncbi:uncharacterized protein KD926_007912 [Aspergillus affinis]|uniref:uncharacterized protein n=1 Tax=Aspergillus affinis TaxID=1070780 RepID=UPI0022FEA461|nr:uncharacterized protein KD926_007912 [Aspergillus affinis]KAI9045497.1 hypothetical protein KD926_007912 [Aspergillus affinis]
MKYSNAAILGFLGCALALPTPAQDESQGLPNLALPIPSGISDLLHPSGAPSGSDSSSGGAGGLLPSGLPDISKLLPTDLPIKRDESGGLPFPIPSGISDLLNGGSGGSGSSSGGSGNLPIPSGISDLLHGGSSGSGSSSGSGGLPSGLPDLTKLLPTDLPIKRDESGGLPFPIPSGISDLLNGGSSGSGSSSGGSGSLPIPSGISNLLNGGSGGSGSSSGGTGGLLPSGLPDISKLLPTDLPIKRAEEEGRLPFHLLPSGFPNFPNLPKPTGLFPEPPKPVGGEQPAPTPTSAAVPTRSAVAFKA